MINSNVVVKDSAPKRRLFSMSQKDIIGKIVTYILLGLLSVIWIVPILWIILCAFRVEYQLDGTYISIIPSTYFPKSFGFKNFVDLFKEPFYNIPNAFPRWMLNTLIVSVCCCLISTFLILSVAYCMSKLRFKLRKPFMNLTMVIGLFPGFMSMIAIYYLLKAIGLTQSLAGLILAYSAGAGLGYQIAKGYFDVIPTSLVESAKLDGCSNFNIFLKVILPLAKPIIIYTALTCFTGPWMDFIFAKVIIGDTHPEYWTVSVGLYNIMFGPQAKTNYFSMFAAGCVCIGVPITLLFMFLQRYYVEGVTAGAVKG